MVVGVELDELIVVQNSDVGKILGVVDISVVEE